MQPLWGCELIARSPAGCKTASSGIPRSQRSPCLASWCNLTTEKEIPLQYTRLLKDFEARYENRMKA